MMGVVLVLANSPHSFDSDRFLDVCHCVLIVSGSTQYMIGVALVLANSPHSFNFGRFVVGLRFQLSWFSVVNLVAPAVGIGILIAIVFQFRLQWFDSDFDC